MNIGIIIPELAKHGGAERLVIECLMRWQDEHQITVYATKIDRKMLDLYGLQKSVRFKLLTPYFEGPHALLLNSSLLPKIWQREVELHEVYLNHLWPTHLVDVHPMVWYPHEPLRMLYDLRYDAAFDDPAQRNIHIYPKYYYDTVSTLIHEATLDAIKNFDQMGRPDRVVANSRYIAGYLKHVYGRDVEDVVFPGIEIEHYYDPSFFRPCPVASQSEEWGLPVLATGLVPSNSSKQADIILAVGQLWPHKQMDRILEAVGLTDRTQLYIVGNGPEKESLERIAESLGISDRVFFLHGLTDAQVQLLYARCLVVVFMAKREPFGIVPMEALAAGKPLIANNEGGFTELVDDSCAFLVSAQPSVIAEKITFLQRHPDVAAAMGNAGREIAARHTWSRHAREMLEILEATAAARIPDPGHSLRSEQRKTLSGAHYYCWYGQGAGARHWNDDIRFGGVTDMPRVGYYASCNGDVILDHFRIAEQMGLDFLILNLHVNEFGVDPYELGVIENMFALAGTVATPLKFWVQLCPYNVTTEGFRSAMEAVRNRFFHEARYLRIESRPVLGLFWSGYWDRDANWLAFLKEQFADCFALAGSLRLYDHQAEYEKTQGLFDAWSLFSPLELCRFEDGPSLWRKAYEDAAAGRSGLRVFTLSPGYDDRHLRAPEREGNPVRLVPRKDGAVFRTMVDVALALEKRPDMVIVSTFNEYHENSHIEASLKHGDRYVEMMRGFVFEIKGAGE